MLEVKHFRVVFDKSESHVIYLQYVDKEITLRLEPCYHGFDVALYDRQGKLLKTKECTQFYNFNTGHALAKAVEIAGYTYNFYYANKRT